MTVILKILREIQTEISGLKARRPDSMKENTFLY